MPGWSKSRQAGVWLLGTQRQAPAMDYYKWLMDIARNPAEYPDFMQGYLQNIMPQIGEWATAGGVYNPAAVARKASENLFPYLMSLGIQGAAGTAGTPVPQLGQVSTAPTPAERLQQPFGGCCFIFVEADNGNLDNIARKYRDEFGTEKQKSGYKRLANWLVPKMKQSRFIKNLVKWFMVKPMIEAGKAFYGQNNWGFLFWPLGIAWLILFDILGNKQYEYKYAIPEGSL